MNSYYAQMARETVQYRVYEVQNRTGCWSWGSCRPGTETIFLLYPHLNFLHYHAVYTRLFFNYVPLGAICHFLKKRTIVNSHYLEKAFWKMMEGPIVERTLILECKDLGSIPCSPLSFAISGVSPNLPGFSVLLYQVENYEYTLFLCIKAYLEEQPSCRCELS